MLAMRFLLCEHFVTLSLTLLLPLLAPFAANAEDCPLTTSLTLPLEFDLTGLSGISFVGAKPIVRRVAADDPMIKVLGFRYERQCNFLLELV